MPEEDNYRVEHWDREDGRLIMTVAKASTFNIILAAWHAALRTVPSAHLVLINAGRVMGREETPEHAFETESKIDGKDAGTEVCFGDLRRWHTMRVFCASCRNQKVIDRAWAVRTWGSDTRISAIERRMTCSKCRTGPVRLEVNMAKRD